MADYKFDFLRNFIDKLFDETGFAEMTEEARGQFVPQFVAEAERRLGMALLPLLDEAKADELMKLTNQNGSPEQMAEFWKSNVPGFEAVVNKTLQDFIVEFKQTLAKTAV